MIRNYVVAIDYRYAQMILNINAECLSSTINSFATYAISRQIKISSSYERGYDRSKLPFSSELL